MSNYEVNPLGEILVHMYKCDAVGTCHRSTWTTELSGSGDFYVVTRETAAEHVRRTGHQVEYVRGTVETLVPMRTNARPAVLPH
jgi:hypothetical protein